MPIYEFVCDTCGQTFEALTRLAERDTARPACSPDGACPGSGARAGVQPFSLGKAAYQCQAILGNGEKVRGHFGKSAAMLRGFRGRRA